MSYAVTFRPAAVSDLKRIYLTIAEASGHMRAGRYIERIEQACTALSTFPERGSMRNHIHPGLRIIGFEGSASIAFIVNQDSVEILRVLSRGMDFPEDWTAAD